MSFFSIVRIDRRTNKIEEKIDTIRWWWWWSYSPDNLVKIFFINQCRLREDDERNNCVCRKGFRRGKTNSLIYGDIYIFLGKQSWEEKNLTEKWERENKLDKHQWRSSIYSDRLLIMREEETQRTSILISNQILIGFLSCVSLFLVFVNRQHRKKTLQ